MKRTISALFLFLSSAVSLLAQISPTPVINNEVRDNSSMKMREVSLERTKRDAKKPFPKETNEEAAIRFALIKSDFENIQKLQAEIIKAYTTGKEVNYLQISESAEEMHKKSVRLELNLFNTKFEKEQKDEKKKQPGVRDLIIELDKAISNFVESPLFKNNKLVEQKEAEKSQANLEIIIKLSEILSREAGKNLEN